MQRAEEQASNGRAFIETVRAQALQAAVAPAPSAAVEVASKGVHGYFVPCSMFEGAEAGNDKSSPEDESVIKVRTKQIQMISTSPYPWRKH
jgi:hypothetical protein